MALTAFAGNTACSTFRYSTTSIESVQAARFFASAGMTAAEPPGLPVSCLDHDVGVEF